MKNLLLVAPKNYLDNVFTKHCLQFMNSRKLLCLQSKLLFIVYTILICKHNIKKLNINTRSIRNEFKKR